MEAVRAILTGDEVSEDEIAAGLESISTAPSTETAWMRAMQLFAHYQYEQDEIDEALLGEGIEPDFQ